MATHRNRYLKVALFENAGVPNIMGSTVVGQTAEYILVERPAPKPRAAKAAARKPRTNAKAAAAPTTGVSFTGTGGKEGANG